MMNNGVDTMKTSTVIATLTGIALSLTLSTTALAGNKHKHHSRIEYARVVDARPIYQRITHQVPQESCHYETVSYRNNSNSSYTGTVVGGLLGAAIGHELGHSKRNKDVAAVAGGLLGASIGRDISRNKSPGRAEYRDQQVCHTRYVTEYSQQLMGYDVTYKYQGRTYQTRTNQHPGSRIPVDVHVRPVYRR
jgi:uncharacterized protein YcfJ